MMKNKILIICSLLLLSSCVKKQCWTFRVKMTNESWCAQKYSVNKSENKLFHCNMTRIEAHKMKKEIEDTYNTVFVSPTCLQKTTCEVSIE